MATPRALAFPFAIDALGRVAFTEDPVQQTRDQLHMLLNTNLFERVMRPRYGVDLKAYVFGFDDDVEASRIRNEIEAALATWLPVVTVIDVQAEATDDGRLIVNLSYSIPSTTSSDPTVYSAIIEVGGTVVGA